MSIDDMVASLQILKQQAEGVYDLVVKGHRHRDFSYADCPECRLRAKVAFINDELNRLLRSKLER